VPAGEVVHGPLGIVEAHAVELVHGPQAAEVLHDHHEAAGLLVDRRVVAEGTRTGASWASSLKNRASRMYMRRMVEVNTAASSRAGSFITTESGQPSPSTRNR
jgi:hypothetical protein